MLTINEYSQSLQLPQYTPQSYDPTLEVQVALYKQNNYDKVLQTVKGLQSQALNISMLNQEGQQRLDAYNKELNETLSGDLGDLSKVEVQNNIANMFQKIAGDTQLAKASQLSAQYQEQIDVIESFRQSGRKDKGYNSINETVFKEWDGGLYDFMQSGLNQVTNPGFQPIKYTPFKELDTKLLNIAKTLHADTQVTEGASGSEGYLLHKEITQVSPEKVRQLMTSQFDQEDLEQLDVMAKYEIIQNRRLNTLPEFYEKYNQFADSDINRSQTQSDVLKQQADYFTSLINKKDTPDDKKAEYTKLVDDLKNQSLLYDQRVLSLKQSKKQYSDFEKMSNEELLQYAKEMQWANKINSLSEALSWKKEVEIYKPDQLWMFNKKMDVLKWQEQVRASTKLAISRMAKEETPKGPEFSAPIDAVKNPIKFVDSYKTLADMQQYVASKSNRIISSPSFNPNNLLNPEWLKQNKDNYEVKMWDIFSHQNQAIRGDKPQLEYFKLWLKDQESNPEGIIAGYVQDQQRNEVVSNYLDTKLMEINQATRSKTNEYDFMEGYPMYKSDGSKLSRQEYNAGVPAYIGVPVDKRKSSYRLVKLSDALEDAKQIQSKILKSSPMIYGDYSGDYNTGIYNDKGLTNVLLNLSKLKENVNTQLEEEMIGRLPQIFQTGVVDAMNEEAMKIYWPEVASTAKNVNENMQFALDFEDIAFIRPPISGNKGQFQLKTALSKDYTELGYKLPDAVDPSKLVPIVPGGSYSFETNNPYMPYDVLLNEASKLNPVKSSYKGYTIEVSKSDVTNNTFVKVLDSKGQLIKEGQIGKDSDINQMFSAMRQYIDTINK